MKYIIRKASLFLALVTLFTFCTFAFASCSDKDKNEVIKIEISVTDYGKMVLELYPDVAPITVENFMSYVREGFYDGLIFHRIVDGFMIQGGDPTGTRYGDSNLPTIKGEFSANGVENDLKFVTGTIGMARSKSYNSASTQFFICLEPFTRESGGDGLYASFGQVIEGFDVLAKIGKVATGVNDRPLSKVVIEYIKEID